MLKKNCYFLLMLASTQCFAQSSIDAVTSASGKLEILGGQAYSDYAEIQWKDDYNNGSSHLLKYGTTQSYANQINLFPFARRTTITTTIRNLTPGTLYYAQFYRVHEGTARTTNFQFTTSASTAVAQKSHARKDFMVTASKTIEVIGMDGRQLTGFELQQFLQQYTGESTMKSSVLSSGIYKVRMIDNLSHKKSLSAVTIIR